MCPVLQSSSGLIFLDKPADLLKLLKNFNLSSMYLIESLRIKGQEVNIPDYRGFYERSVAFQGRWAAVGP